MTKSSKGATGPRTPADRRRAADQAGRALGAEDKAEDGAEDGAQGDGDRKMVAAGSATIDVIAVVSSGRLERVRLDYAGFSFLLLEEGRKYPAETIATHVGGGGANAAVSAARLGWRSVLLGVTGDDRNGEAVRAHLSENRVAVEALRRTPDAETGVSVMVASHRRNPPILVHRGANECLRLDDVRDAVFEGAALVYIAPLSSGSAECFPALVEQGAWAGAMVAANPGIRQLTGRTDAFLRAIGNLDLLSLNARELTALAPALIDRGAVEAAGGDGDGDADAEAAAQDEPSQPARLLNATLGEGGRSAAFRELVAALHALGPRLVSITDGEDGAYLSIAADPSAAEGDPAALARLLFEPAALVEQVRGTAGAGDAYGSTLACLIAEGAPPEKAMRLAAQNAASVVSYVNTTDGLLDRAGLEARALEERRLEE